MTRVLIVGVSTRGLAESAAGAGYEVVALDGFGDLDLRARAHRVVVARRAGRFSVRAALARARELPRDATSYVASFENHPDAVAALARAGPLWGNPPAVLRAVRDPIRLARTLARRGYATPAAHRLAPRGAREHAGQWLLKPLASGGGRGVSVWRGGAVPARSYLQRRIRGTAGSVVFAANGRDAVVLGVSQALAGDPRFGAAQFRYCGSILTTPTPAVLRQARRLAESVTDAFGLVGVNGIDFILARGVPYPIEVNPRYTASMELVERACGLSIFETHVRACAGALPAPDGAWAARGLARRTVGKAIVYARRPVTPADTASWLGDDDVRDIPPAGEPIAAGRPICTIFARGASVANCRAALAVRASLVYTALEARARSIA